MLQTNVCNGQAVCQFSSLFGVCTLLGRKIFEDHLLNVIGRLLDEFSQECISLYLYLGLFFENRKNSGLAPGQNDDPVTR